MVIAGLLLVFSGQVTGQDDPYEALKQEYIRFVSDPCLLSSLQVMDINNELSLEEEQKIFLDAKQDKNHLIRIEREVNRVLPVLVIMSVQERMSWYMTRSKGCEELGEQKSQEFIEYRDRKEKVKEEFSKYVVLECNEYIAKDLGYNSLDELRKDGGPYQPIAYDLEHKGLDQLLSDIARLENLDDRMGVYKTSLGVCIKRYENLE